MHYQAEVGRAGGFVNDALTKMNFTMTSIFPLLTFSKTHHYYSYVSLKETGGKIINTY